MQRIDNYIYHQPNWTNLFWDQEKVSTKLAETRNLQGRLLGKMLSLGFDMQNEAVLKTISVDVLKSSEIEGEFLDADQVMSSIAKRLGLEITVAVPSDRDVEGMVEMMLDATQLSDKPLTKERLFDWHAALFPTERSGMYNINVATWRKDAKGPMQVVSGPLGKEKIHFEAPAAERIEDEMEKFLSWFEGEESIDLVLKAAIAHLWLVTIHPFEDGNGRITRATTDLLLARSDKTTMRFYSMSAQIRIERKEYYDQLERAQKSNSDITGWIMWFLQCLINAIQASEEMLQKVFLKARFWKMHATTKLNDRQQKIIKLLLNDFEGNLNTSKWAKLTKCSSDTALRDIQDLMEKQILQKESSGGRSTRYDLNRQIVKGNETHTSN